MRRTLKKPTGENQNLKGKGDGAGIVFTKKRKESHKDANVKDVP